MNKVITTIILAVISLTPIYSYASHVDFGRGVYAGWIVFILGSIALILSISKGKKIQEAIESKFSRTGGKLLLVVLVVALIVLAYQWVS